MRVQTEKGFSLIELMIVVAIIAIFAAVAIPAFVHWIPNMRLKAAARDLYSNFQQARMEAIKRNRDVVIVLQKVTCSGLPSRVPKPGGGFLVFVDDGSGSGTAGDQQQNGSEPTLVDYKMPVHTALCAENFSGSITGFTPKGLVIKNKIGDATVNNDQGRSYKLSLTIAGGVRLQ